LIEVNFIGDGSALHASGEVLGRAGFEIRRSAELEKGDRSPIILGETPAAFTIARDAIAAGRHLLIANPATLPADRLSRLFTERKPNQSLFVWDERRYHPAYRFVANLIESDSAWRPRYIRQETLGMEAATGQQAYWQTLEGIALLLVMTGDVPITVAATSIPNPVRNAPDLLSLTIGFHDLYGFLRIGLGEAMERRETIVASSSRKACIDELNERVPLRLVEDEPKKGAAEDRWLSFQMPNVLELVRQQCIAFLDASLDSGLAQAEARLWTRALASMEAMDESIDNEGAPALVKQPASEQSRLRLILGRSGGKQQAPPPSVA
jgi:hypothetical protein